MSFVLLYGRPLIVPVAALMVYGSVLMGVFAYYGNYGILLAPYGFGALAYGAAFLRWKYDTILFRLEPDGGLVASAA